MTLLWFNQKNYNFLNRCISVILYRQPIIHFTSDEAITPLRFSVFLVRNPEIRISRQFVVKSWWWSIETWALRSNRGAGRLDSQHNCQLFVCRLGMEQLLTIDPIQVLSLKLPEKLFLHSIIRYNVPKKYYNMNLFWFNISWTDTIHICHLSVIYRQLIIHLESDQEITSSSFCVPGQKTEKFVFHSVKSSWWFMETWAL